MHQNVHLKYNILLYTNQVWQVNEARVLLKDLFQRRGLSVNPESAVGVRLLHTPFDRRGILWIWSQPRAVAIITIINYFVIITFSNYFILAIIYRQSFILSTKLQKISECGVIMLSQELIAASEQETLNIHNHSGGITFSLTLFHR